MMNDPGPMVIADPLAVFERQGMVKLVAPAKVNLFLGVGGLRSDGYHEVTTVMHALDLHDVLHMDYYPESSGGLQIEVNCYAREGLPSLDITSEDNLVVRAIRLLAQKLGRTQDETFRIRIEKHIPFEAGLGGGSSDAAAALLGAAKFWDLAVPISGKRAVQPINSEAPMSKIADFKAYDYATFAPEVLAAAAEIGSDVSFFLYGGCACLTGAGEAYSHRLAPMKKVVVLVKPDKGVSTKLAYELFDKNPAFVPKDIAHKATTTPWGKDVPLFNNLAPVVEVIYPELATIRTWLQEQPGVEGALLCGSGSATIALCSNFEVACKISGLAQVQGWWARTTALNPLGAAIVPQKKVNLS